MIGKVLANFMPPPAELSATQRERLDLVKQKLTVKSTTRLAIDRIVVVDVETSGLSLSSDRLLAIGAVGIHGGRIAIADTFEVLLKQEIASDKANILVHGIGGTAQRNGQPPADALLDFLEYLDGAPLFAFHVVFDETMLRRACKKFLNFEFRHTWVDLAYLLPELFPQHAKKCHALDDWLAQFSIHNDERHNALADALATAQLGLMSLHYAQTKGIDNFKSLLGIESAQRWLSAARY